MTTEKIIQTILEQLGGRRFILMTGAKFSYGINEKQQPYLRCILPKNLESKNRTNCFSITYNYADGLYQITLMQHNYYDYTIVKVLDSVYPGDLIPIFEHESGVRCTLATLI